MAGPIVYLASDAASFVTGTLTLIDGGWTAVDGRFSVVTRYQSNRAIDPYKTRILKIARDRALSVPLTWARFG
jgi:hypothetical protein